MAIVQTRERTTDGIDESRIEKADLLTRIVVRATGRRRTPFPDAAKQLVWSSRQSSD
jgi:hypothetical protein